MSNRSSGRRRTVRPVVGIKSIPISAVVVVKWSACLPSTLSIRVRIPLNPTVFSAFEKNENKRGRVGLFLLLKSSPIFPKVYLNVFTALFT